MIFAIDTAGCAVIRDARPQRDMKMTDLVLSRVIAPDSPTISRDAARPVIYQAVQFVRAYYTRKTSLASLFDFLAAGGHLFWAGPALHMILDELVLERFQAFPDLADAIVGGCRWSSEDLRAIEAVGQAGSEAR